MRRVVENNRTDYLLSARAATRTIVLIILVVAAAVGCSRTNEPESHGTINVRFYFDEPGQEGISFSPAQVTLDSVIVRVFRGGSGVTHETARGLRINGAGQVDMTITCVAENDKKVSVELFGGYAMRYFGVDEHVDVNENENTSIMIDARDIFVDQLDVTPQTYVYDPTPPVPSHQVSWTAVDAAASYLVVESSSPGFEQQNTQSFLTTDVSMTFTHAGGAWYYMVAPLNPYAVGSFSDMGYAYVQSPGELPPQIDAVTPWEAAPGEPVTLTGRNLGVPGRVLIGTAECPTVSASETELVFIVPVTAHTGSISFEHVMGTVVDVPGTFVVDRIAYVTGASPDDPVTNAYVALIENSQSISSGVAVVPVDELADRDMRVFEVIIVAHDVAGAQFGPSPAEVQAISGSGAQVFAVGRGGEAYLALVFASLNGSSVPDASPERELYFSDSSPIFGSVSPTPAPGSYLEISATDPGELFSSFDFGGFPPSSLTQYASLASTQSNVVLFDFVSTDAMQRQTHNFFWGHRGNPQDLIPESGQQLVLSVIRFLANVNLSVPAAPVPVSF
jgi:hypothetical protein